MSPQMVLPRNRAQPYPQFALNPPPTPPLQESQGESGAGAMAFWVCAAYTFLLFSRTVEFIDNTGRLHLNLISGAICIAVLIATGNVPRMLVSRPGIWLSLFTLWLFFGLPFSTWKGGSISNFVNGWLKSYLTFFIVGGLIFSLKQYRRMTLLLGISTLSQIYLAFRRSGGTEDDRLAVTYGSLGNANDLASALLMGAPFIVFAITDKRLNPFLRVLFIPALAVLLVAVLKTGSRGGLIAIAVLILFAFFKTSASGKFLILAVGIAVIVIFAAVVPLELRSRYMTIFKTDVTSATTAGAESALESSNARRGLIQNAAILTLRNPLVGVGLGQFSSQSFNLFVERGVTGMWFTCHDIFGLVAAETGVPGLIFFCCIIVTSFRTLSRIGRLPAVNIQQETISRMSYTVMMSLVAYVTCGIFNTQAYSYQLPVLASLAAALERVAVPYFEATANPEAPPAQPLFVNRRYAAAQAARPTS
jgi:hypothetical protein